MKNVTIHRLNSDILVKNMSRADGLRLVPVRQWVLFKFGNPSSTFYHRFLSSDAYPILGRRISNLESRISTHVMMSSLEDCRVLC